MKIRKLFESRLATWAATNSLPVAWENAPFTPAPGQTYLRAFLLRGATTSLDLLGAHRRYVGVFQVSVIAPSGVGSGAAETIAESIAALFPMNLRMVDGAVVVIVTQPMALHTVLVDGDICTVPVSCRYQSDTY